MIALQDKQTLAAYALADPLLDAFAEMQRLFDRCAPQNPSSWEYKMERAEYLALEHAALRNHATTFHPVEKGKEADPPTFSGIQIKIGP